MHYKYLPEFAYYLIKNKQEFVKDCLTVLVEGESLGAEGSLDNLIPIFTQKTTKFLSFLSTISSDKGNCSLKALSVSFLQNSTEPVEYSKYYKLENVRKKVLLDWLVKYQSGQPILFLEVENFYHNLFYENFKTIDQQQNNELSNEKQLTQTVLDASLNSIVALEAIRNSRGKIVDFKYVLLNETALQMLSRPLEIMLGNTVLKEFPGVVNEGIFEKYKNTVETGEVFDQEFFYENEGLRNWFRQTAKKWRDGLVVTTVEISGLKNTEEKLIKANSELNDSKIKLLESNQKLEAIVEERTSVLTALNELNQIIAGELNLNNIVQAVIDKTTALSGAEFGAFFYNVEDEDGELYTLHTFSGDSIDHFSNFPNPRNTKVFSPTFKGEAIVRSDDITKDPRYGKNNPYFGMPKGHLPVKSYLAVPVVSRSGEVLGGLFYGHSKACVFSEESEKLVASVTTHTAIAIDNAKLFAQLKGSEERFRFMAETMPQIVWTADQNGKIEYFNKHFYQLTGIPKIENNSEIICIIHQEDWQKYQTKWEESLSSGKLFQVEYRIRSKEGKYRWHLARAASMKNNKGEIIKWFGTSTDIHNQKEALENVESAKKELEQITNRLQILSKATHDVIWDWDVSNNKIWWNEGFQILFGYEKKEIEEGPESWYSRIHPEDKQRVLEGIYKVINKKGKHWDDTYRFKHKNGSYRLIYDRGYTLYNGESVQMIGAMVDVTDKQVFEEKLSTISAHLQHSENQLKLITNTIPAFIAYVDSNEVYRFKNDYYSKLQLQGETIIGKKVSEVLPEIVYNLSKPFIEKALNGEAVSFENQLPLKNGTSIEAEVSFVPDIDVSGTVKGYVVMAIDLTERLQFERTLEKSNKELIKTNTDLDNFIYTASHDLRAPVSNIEGLIYAIREWVEASKIVDSDLNILLQMVNQSIIKFKETIGDLTEITKVQRNFDEEAIEQVVVKEVFEDVKSSIKEMVKSSKVVLIDSFQDGLTVNLSKASLNSVLLNLITNAIKYRSSERKSVVEISGENSENGILLKVKDNGVGIRKNQVDKIFMMFKRLHTHVEGSGIGLYIVKRIVENSGGRIEVESEENKGTTFYIYLN